MPSFPEHVEEAGSESVSEPKKKGSRKSKKGALDLGLGPEVQTEIEGQLEEEEHGWEKVRACSRFIIQLKKPRAYTHPVVG